MDGPDLARLLAFFASATLLAVIPGPGMLYVLARTVRGGRREGLASTLGTAAAGLLHTLAAALGISALLAASATAFTVVKWVGAAYLVWLGVRTLLERPLPSGAVLSEGAGTPSRATASRDAWSAFRQGLVTEALNPKTALFFLAFIPQFIDPSGAAFVQFVALGAVTTLLTSGADLVVVLLAGRARTLLTGSRRARRVQKGVSGGTLIGLGIYAAASE